MALASVTLGCLFLVVQCANTVAYKSNCAEVKNNLHAIQLALERYSSDNNGDYPLSIETICITGYLQELPLNPFTGEPMRCISDADTAQSGDFSYEPQRTDGTTAATAYTLRAWF
jgi:hypothetical protein